MLLTISISSNTLSSESPLASVATRRSHLSTPASIPSMTIFFVHIPKTAGTALRKVISDNYRPWQTHSLYRHVFHGETDSFWEDYHGRLAWWRRRMTRIVVGHTTGRLFPYWPQPTTGFTVLRDPVDRVVSLYHYARSLDRASPPPSAQVIQQHDLSLEDIFEDGLRLLGQSYQEFYPLRQYFNGHVRNLRPEFDRSGVLLIPNDEEIRIAVDRTAQMLNDHFLVGFQSHLSESVQYFGRKLGWRRTDVSRQRVNAQRPTLSEIDPKLRETILHHNQADQKLYEQLKEQRLPEILVAGDNA